jgi:hypothetical protein
MAGLAAAIPIGCAQRKRDHRHKAGDDTLVAPHPLRSTTHRHPTPMPSWPHLLRPSTSWNRVARKAWVPGPSPGMTVEGFVGRYVIPDEASAKIRDRVPDEARVSLPLVGRARVGVPALRWFQSCAHTPTSISSPLFRMNRHKGEEGCRCHSRRTIVGPLTRPVMTTKRDS